MAFLICGKCEGVNDVTSFHIGDRPYTLCADCRTELLTKRPARGQQSEGSSRPAGRPSLGVTQKVSLTLPEDTWAWFDEKAAGNRSELVRYLIGRERSPEREWSNNACLGYAIFGAQKLGYSEEQIQQLVRSIYSEFDLKTVEEAKEVYSQSPY